MNDGPVNLRSSLVCGTAASELLRQAVPHGPSRVVGLDDNVLGTKTVFEAAQAADCKKFVLISTDKARDPFNVMRPASAPAHHGGYGARQRGPDLRA